MTGENHRDSDCVLIRHENNMEKGDSEEHGRRRNQISHQSDDKMTWRVADLQGSEDAISLQKRQAVMHEKNQAVRNQRIILLYGNRILPSKSGDKKGRTLFCLKTRSLKSRMVEELRRDVDQLKGRVLRPLFLSTGKKRRALLMKWAVPKEKAQKTGIVLLWSKGTKSLLEGGPFT